VNSSRNRCHSAGENSAGELVQTEAGELRKRGWVCVIAGQVRLTGPVRPAKIKGF
jgi:hypothetical protein